MPRKELMRWDGTQNRWRKYKGREFARSPEQLGGVGREDTREAANAWWEATLAELEGTKEPTLEEIAIAKRQKIKAVAEATGNEELAQRQDEQIEHLQAVIAGEQSPADNPDAKRLIQEITHDAVGPEDAEAKRQHAVAQAAALPQQFTPAETALLQVAERTGKAKTTERSIAFHTKAFIDLLRAKANNGTNEAGTFSNVERFVNRFAEFVKTDSDIDVVASPETYRNYYVHLSALLAEGKLVEESCRRALNTAVRFANYLDDEGAVVLPRKLYSKELSFRVSQKEVETPPPSEVVKLVNQASLLPAANQFKLHLLLMANCGMYQSDIGELKKSEVDWKLGRIKRRRTKTKHETNPPTVDYKLWSITFELLKQHRDTDKRKELCLYTQAGNPWVNRRMEDGEEVRGDGVASNFASLKKEGILRKDGTKAPAKIKTKLLLMQIRKISGSIIKKIDSSFFDYFLGHANHTVGERYYDNKKISAAEAFDLAVEAVGKEYGFVEK